MKTIGITGGVGSGKTTIMNLLRDKFGAHVIYADNVAHELIEPDKINYNQIVAHFGTSILKEDATIDRKILGDIVFQQKEELAVLNSIVHPNVEREIRKQVDEVSKEGNAAFIAVEAAQLLDAGYQEFLDEIWYIYADETIRIDRLVESRGYTREKCTHIIKNQMSDQDFRSQCDYVIDTSNGVYFAEKQVNGILNTQ